MSIPARAPLYRAHKIVICKDQKDITTRDLLECYIAIQISSESFRVVKHSFQKLGNSPKPISELADFISESYTSIKELTYIVNE